MNLIKDKWIPAKRSDGSTCTIAPWEIGADKNPVVKINASRPDFRGALYQFLIGLVQTIYTPEDDEEWKERWENPPLGEELKKAFEKIATAFELVNENGPAFMQDYNLPNDAENSDIRSLLINSPGDITIKNNLDHFIKRECIKGLCDYCTATALFCLQTNAPAGGQGNRTSLRGGGPLTTLVIPSEQQTKLWETVWINIITKEDRFANSDHQAVNDIFPWMGATHDSKDGKQVFPEQVNELQLYWGTPRRIRLANFNANGICDICARESRIWTDFRAINYGVKYSSTWLHVLSPYRRQEEKDQSTSLLAIKGKQGGFSYPDWLALTLITNPEKQEVAQVLRFFIEKKQWIIPDKKFRIWCSGFDMDNMKARCWYDNSMPFFSIPSNMHSSFIEKIEKMTTAANDTARLLRGQVKAAWFKRPKEANGDTSFIISTFWEETETHFFTIADQIRVALMAGITTAPILASWQTIIIKTTKRIFDHFALQETDDVKNMKRIANAAKALDDILPKLKSIQALKEEE